MDLCVEVAAYAAHWSSGHARWVVPSTPVGHDWNVAALGCCTKTAQPGLQTPPRSRPSTCLLVPRFNQFTGNYDVSVGIQAA